MVGDRVILRFLRAKNMHIDSACKLYRDFLRWRVQNEVDYIRMDILYGGKHSPLDFPYGQAILSIAPQIIITRHARDVHGQPLVTESYNFSPKDVLKAVTVEQYLLFLLYTLEYRSLVLEQLSHEMEQEYLQKHPKEEDREDGYGVVLMDITIRDMKGIGMAHLGSDGRSIVSAALKAALRKSYL